MAIKMSEFMKELQTSRAGIDPQEKLRQWQELKQGKNTSETSPKAGSKPKSVNPTLIVLSADPQQRKEANSNEEKSE